MTESEAAKHNEDARQVWAAWRTGAPVRVPMSLGISERFFLSDPRLNATRIGYREFHTDPETMLRVQLWLEDFRRHSLPADHEMGMPDRWHPWVSGGNFSHSAWYGCPVQYGGGDSPDTLPLLEDDNRNMLFDRGIPDPFSGIYGEFRDILEDWKGRARTLRWRGREIDPDVDVPPASTMGNGIPFTTACKLRGTTQMCTDVALEPAYVERLLAYITDSIVLAIKAWRRYLGRPIRTDFVMLGDDSCVLLSPEQYRQFVLPHHRRIYEEFGTPGAERGVHLCGAAQRHLPVLVRELGVRALDTGYPLDLRRLAEEVGDEVRIDGGVRVELLRAGTPGQVSEETRRILDEMASHRRFVLRDANLLAPGTPPENLRAMYDACLRHRSGHGAAAAKVDRRLRS